MVGSGLKVELQNFTEFADGLQCGVKIRHVKPECKHFGLSIEE